MIIRKANIPDTESIIRLMVESDNYISELIPKKHRVFSKRVRNTSMLDKYIKGIIKNSKSIFVVSEENGIIIGCGSAAIMTSTNLFYKSIKVGMLANAYVIKEMRGKGIGKKILKYRQDWLKKKGCKYARMLVMDDNRLMKNRCTKEGYWTMSHNYIKKI